MSIANTKEQGSTNKPKEKFRFGNMILSVWENQVKVDEKETVVRNYTLSKTYLSEGRYKYSSNFYKGDLIDIKFLIENLIKWEEVKK